MATFFGLHVAVSGLRAQQQAMNVTAHNIANAGTAGYHRQEAIFSPSAAVASGGSSGYPQLGSGVMVDCIRRMQSDYVDGQIRTANQWLGSWNFKNEALQQIEAVIAEPSELGLSKFLNNFWDSWSELSSNPGEAARDSVVENSTALAHKIRSLYTDMRDIQTRTDQDVSDSVDRVNALATEIAHLNQQIRKSNAGGYQANDILDQRDILLDELSTLAQIDVDGVQGSELIVNIGGTPLIQGTEVSKITLTDGPTGFSQLTWEDSGIPVAIKGGQIAGEIEFRDKIVQGYIDDLNAIAKNIANSVNALHITGIAQDGGPAGLFFNEDATAGNITVVADSDHVASSASADNGNKLAEMIGDLKDTKVMGDQTINEAYTSLVAKIGSNSREALSRTSVYQASISQLATQKDSISGVSIDEEMANMVRFQQAYNASARIFTVLDEMLETVVNGMGIGGR